LNRLSKEEIKRKIKYYYDSLSDDEILKRLESNGEIEFIEDDFYFNHYNLNRVKHSNFDLTEVDDTSIKCKPKNTFDLPDEKRERYLGALREIDNHTRSTDNPFPYIIKTLKDTLPEWEEE